MNGYVEKEGQKYLWVGRRSQTKSTYPGMLDHLVAGGLVCKNLQIFFYKDWISCLRCTYDWTFNLDIFSNFGLSKHTACQSECCSVEALFSAL